MGVVAPVSGVAAALLPVAVGLAAGDEPSLLAWAGIAVAFPEARDQLGELVNRAAYSDERIVLTRHGRAVAALVPIAVLHDLEDAEDAADLDAARAAAAESGPNVAHAQVLGELVADEARASRSA